MIQKMALTSCLKLVVPISLLALSGCSDLQNQPYSGPYGGYNNDPYYGRYDGYNDYEKRREWEHRHRERHEIEKERERLEEERRRLEEERNRQISSPQVNQPTSRPAQDRCPAGFQPSERKCSPEERRRGCKDIRLPSGLGCVRR